MTTVSVFFYGLFMDAALLEKKGVNIKSCLPARLDGYAIKIGQRAALVVESLTQVDAARLEQLAGSTYDASNQE